MSRVLLALASILLVVALPMPLWSVRLIAPQYPEGLGMDIHARTVEGMKEHDLDNINELNHYIGMKTIQPESIPELHIIPWVIAGLAVFGLVIAALGKRALAIAWVVSFLVAGAVGMWDFWRWEYDYGHNLDFAHAIIKVPGMTYQPPLIGSKQLLNFTATSMPDIGTVLIGVAFALGVAACAIGFHRRASVAVPA